MSNSTIKDNSNIKDLVSIYGESLNNNYKYGISMLFENNKFINNINCDSLIFAKGIDLETYILYITAINNIFKQNTVNIAIFDLKNAQLDFLNSSVGNDSQIISGTVVEIDILNITTNDTTALFLNDTSESLIVKDRWGYQQLPVRTIGDTSLISPFTKINNQFTDNIFEPALIDTAVDHSSCDFNNNAKNGNDASPCRCMYIDTTYIHSQ